jgi:hypothetical protein
VLDHCLMQQEVELSKPRHTRDLNEKKRLSRMVGNKVSIINSCATLLSLCLGHRL